MAIQLGATAQKVRQALVDGHDIELWQVDRKKISWFKYTHE
jgi:hypothetical protein